MGDWNLIRQGAEDGGCLTIEDLALLRSPIDSDRKALDSTSG